MRQYLLIKNAIISLLLTAMYLKWLVSGTHVLKVIIACVVIFAAIMWLLNMADGCYIRQMKKSA